MQYLMRLESKKRHAIFTHGGLLASLLVGVDSNVHFEHMPPHGSVVGISLPEVKNYEEFKKKATLEFYWEFPVIPEDL